jgi:Mitochondrial ribosomal protein L37
LLKIQKLWELALESHGFACRLRSCVVLDLSVWVPGLAAMSKDVATGVNILKGGSDPPLLPDEEYPEWLWKLAEPQGTLFELRRKYEAAGKDISLMDMKEVGPPLVPWHR